MSNADRPKTEGWAYSQGIDDLEPGADGIFRLYQVYGATDPVYTGKVTVPTLWDRERRRIVNNESSEIIRMFNSAFKASTDVSYDFYPEPCARKSTGSMIWCIAILTTESIAQVSPGTGSLRRGGAKGISVPR